MPETRKCPYCAEEIRAEAIRCPHCRSRVATSDRDRWYRDHPERRVAGVAAAVAHALALPIMGVRLVPFAPGDPSPLERALAAAQKWFGGLRVHCRAAPRPADAPRSGKPNGLGTGAVPGSPLV